MANSTGLNRLAWAIAGILSGGGIVAMATYFSPIPILDLFMLFLQIVIIPVAILGGLGLISWGTVKAIWNPDLKDRISFWLREIERDPDTQGPQTRPASA